MALPISLQKAITSARQAIHKETFYDVPIGYRHMIYALMGTKYPSIPVKDVRGHKRRTHLAIMTARKVIPVWHESGLVEVFPEDMLSLAEYVLHTRLSKSLFGAAVSDSWASMEVYMSRNRTAPSTFAGFAAAQALYVSVFDEKYNPQKINTEATIANYDPYDWDVANFASDAFSCLTYPDFDAEKREVFWDWWLREAIPEAFHQFH